MHIWTKVIEDHEHKGQATKGGLCCHGHQISLITVKNNSRHKTIHGPQWILISQGIILENQGSQWLIDSREKNKPLHISQETNEAIHE